MSTTAKKIVDPVLQASRKLSTPLLSISEHGNMPRTATSFVDPVLQSSRTLSAPSVEHKGTCATCQQRQKVSWTLSYSRQERYQTPLLSTSEHVQHANKGNKFRGPCLTIVKNVISPPTPLLSKREHVQHVNNVDKFCGPCLTVVKNVINPPC